MKTYYCHDDFKTGITCTQRTSDGKCMGGRLCSCEYKSTTPKFRSMAPMTSVKPPKRKSTDCTWCEHRTICALKHKFNRLKAENYPLVCECQYYKECNILFEV